MIRWFFTILFFSNCIFLTAQTDIGLVTYVSFDDCTADESRNDPSTIGVINGSPTCECGVSGRALRLNGTSDNIFFGGSVNSEFGTEDFSLSFYFKPLNNTGVQTIIKKSGADCSSQSNFAIQYDPTPVPRINIEFIENSNKTASIRQFPLPPNNCWYHITLIRRNTRTILYIDGQLAFEAGASSRVNILNDDVLTIGETDCSATSRAFNGLIDELRVYTRALNNDEIAALFFAPDKILTPNSRIFLGEDFSVDIGSTCANRFEWTPTDGVENVEDPNSLLSPSESITYRLDFIDDQGCTAFDTIRLIVIDPNSLGCDQVFLPNAFTPNDDGLNDEYGISNPEIFTFGGADLITFEIFDRWGNLIFQTDRPSEKWNGFYRNEPVNSGVYLHRIQFTCEGQELIETGSLTIIR